MRGHSKFQKHQIDEQLASIEQEKLLEQTSYEQLSFINTRLQNFKKKDSVSYARFLGHESLYVDDSLIINIESHIGSSSAPPWSLIEVFHKNGERLKSFRIPGNEHSGVAIKQTIYDLEKKIAQIKLKEIELKKMSQNDLSFFTFTNYYLNNQLQPLTPLLQWLQSFDRIIAPLFFVIVAPLIDLWMRKILI
jgi:hypothetical protein